MPATKSVQLAYIFHTIYQSKSNPLNGKNTIYALFTTLLAMLESYPRALILIDVSDECHSGSERGLPVLATSAGEGSALAKLTVIFLSASNVRKAGALLKM